MIKHILLLFSLLLLRFTAINAQYTEPMKIPLYLSGNFAELRSGRFHTGIDFKTQGVVNKPVYSVEKGYVSRIFVSPTGYGLALYINHPNGTTSVYAHLNRFIPRIAAFVKEKQYELENFMIDVRIDSTLFTVEKGELIAYSGNTGSSGGPHLHFEIRNTASEAIIDPLPFFKTNIKDTRPPEIQGIAIYPFAGKSVVNQKTTPTRIKISRSETGKPLSLTQLPEAWGTIGIGIKAYDRMDGQNNIYGLHKMLLFVDEELVFSYTTSPFHFHENRMECAFIDYDTWKNNREFYMKSFVEPGNKLPFFASKENGCINIDEEKIYSIRYELEDVHGNKTIFPFSIEGKKQELVAAPECDCKISWENEFYFTADCFSMYIPCENAFTNACFELQQTTSQKYFSDRYKLGNSPLPLFQGADIGIELKTDTLKNKNQYGIVKIGEKGDTWVGGIYERSCIRTRIRELGDEYAVGMDATPPTITPIRPENWESNGIIRIKTTDNLSGIKWYRGTINGNYVLFEYSGQAETYIYKIDKNRIGSGTKQLLFESVDNCGNKTEYRKEINID